MVNKLKRKLYRRGSSFETTKAFIRKKTLEKKNIPGPMLFKLAGSKGNENQISLFNILSNKSSVVNTLTNLCFLKCGSLDQIEALINNANARYGESFGSSNEDIALSRKTSNSRDLKKLIKSSTSFCLISNSCSESFDLDKHSNSYFFNSVLINSGAKKSALSKENKYELTEYGFISEKNILLSNTSFILSYSSNISCLLSEDNFFNNSSLLFRGSSESNLLNESFFAFLPNSTEHLINSFSSPDSSLSRNSLSIFLIFSSLESSSFANSDQFIQLNSFIFDFSFSSNAKVTLAIHITPFFFNSSSFFNSSTFLDIAPLITSATLMSGNDFLNLASNSSGIDNVIFGILIQHIYFYKHNYVYKSFVLLNEVLSKNDE